MKFPGSRYHCLGYVHRPLPPIFEVITSKPIIPYSLWTSVFLLFPPLSTFYTRRVDLRSCIVTSSASKETRSTTTDFTLKDQNTIDSLSFYRHLRQTYRSETPSNHRTHTQKNDQRISGAATCAVESLKDCVNYIHNTGSINPMRFDMVVNSRCVCCERSYRCGVDAHNIDEIVYVGRTTCLPGLDECSGGFREEIGTPFTWDGCGRHWWSKNVDLLSKLRLSHLSPTVRLNYERLSHERPSWKLLRVFANYLQEGKEVGGTWYRLLRRKRAFLLAELFHLK